MSKDRRNLKNLLAGYGAPAPDLEVTGVEMDSRRVSPGDLFLACRGRGTHGLAYLEQALERGAAAVAWEPAEGWARPEIDMPEVAVPELSARAGEIAARFFGMPSANIFTVGITGTDGKTSTTYLVAQALERLGTPCAYIGTLGYGRPGHLAKGVHTTPDPVSLQRQVAHLREIGAEALAMEVSSHALDQNRVAGMQFDVAILTNITRDHLDYHGTVEHYAAAKRRLFERGEVRVALLNLDDAHGRAWAAEISGAKHVVGYGLDAAPPSDGEYLFARELRLDHDGLAFTVDSSWGRAQLRSKLLGRFNACNLLATLGTLLVKGIALDQAVDALAHASTVPGRIEGFRGAKAKPMVVVDYAHTPEALAQILTAVRAHTTGKLWCVFGCGGDRDRGKRPLMAAVAARLADHVIVTDDNPRSEDPKAIADEIHAGLPSGHTARTIHERADAIATAVREAAAEDIVVVAGKGHEDYQIYRGETRRFSDRDYVADLVGAGRIEN